MSTERMAGAIAHIQLATYELENADPATLNSILGCIEHRIEATRQLLASIRGREEVMSVDEENVKYVRYLVEWYRYRVWTDLARREMHIDFEFTSPLSPYQRKLLES